MKCKHLYLLLFNVIPMLVIGQIDLKQIGTYRAGSFDEGGSEIIRYDSRLQQIYSSNGENKAVDVIDISDPTNPVLKQSIDITPYGNAITSVEASQGMILAAVEGEDQQKGKLLVFNGTTGAFIKSFETGVLPDAIRVSPNGQFVVVANEGEPNDDYTVDPEGSITIINLYGGLASFFVDFYINIGRFDYVLSFARVTQLSFSSYNDQREELLAKGVRLFGPNATVAQDLEPENIVFSPSGRRAFISAQENNAMIVVDVRNPRIRDIIALGTKDHSLLGNGFDASDRSSGVNIQSWPVKGFYMPDALGSIRMNGMDYIVSANEGDARDYDGYSEEARVKDLELDPSVYPNADFLQQDEILGRLKTTTAHGDTDDDGDVDQIYSYGARSFSI